jgi:regulator of sigma E protease
MIDLLQTTLSFVLVLGILVFIHELGHFSVAKLFGIGVPVFSLGIGPRLFGFTRKGTEYRVSALPLGGYVRLAGDEADEARTGGPEEFLSRPKWQRLLVYAAGATFNIVFAILAGTAMFRAYGKDEVSIPDAFPVVVDVVAGSPAEQAGVRPGDRIVSIAGRDARDPQTEAEEVTLSPNTRKQVVVEREGSRVTLEVPTGQDPVFHLGFPGWIPVREGMGPAVIDQVVSGTPAHRAGLEVGDKVLGLDDRSPVSEPDLRAMILASPGREIRLRVERKGEAVTVPVTPADEGGKGRIGVNFRPPSTHRDLGLTEAFEESIAFNGAMTRSVFLTLKKLLRFEISLRAFSGPIGIAQVSREAVKTFETFLYFLTLISLQLGVLNLLPVPVLDGGHILILLTEALIRRDLSDKVKERVTQAGLVFLLAFFCVVMYFDVIKTWFSS